MIMKLEKRTKPCVQDENGRFRRRKRLRSSGRLQRTAFGKRLSDRAPVCRDIERGYKSLHAAFVDHFCLVFPQRSATTKNDAIKNSR